MSERDLLATFKTAKQRVQALDEQLKHAKSDQDVAQTALLEYLDAHQASATGKYDGMGWAQVQRPTLYASAPVDQMDAVKAWLRAHGHESAIKETVHPSTLSQIVSEQVEQGGELPPHVTYFLKPNVRLYGGAHE